MERRTDLDDLVRTHKRETASTRGQSVSYQVIGSAITAAEVEQLLSEQLYTQLEDGNEANVTRAAERATNHAGVIISRLGSVLNLDDPTMRAIVLQLTIYELHLALGNAAEGKEYRLKARDLIIAAFGSYPESEKESGGQAPAGAVTTEPRKHWL